ncbi:AF4/FMR2 family member 1-like isoform X2 [Salvelinus fontinalis]|uniref:AF4/FMR2 family member 1-like isoform X2 n=1 Tax=Salvelinus fontinalis TaxID=8038 RepID=UPI0024853F3B|nr:AF4/FMR2 family member 1-like isoform X2 [Salvelinus fontinalis]
MAARSSYNEERNLLRIRERERRNQGTFQEKEFYQETVPLFGEPYKTNKGDELSSRIQRMLGSYEDVNNPNTHQCLDSSFSKDPQSHVATKYGRPSRSRERAKPPFQNPPQYGASQSQSGGPSRGSHSGQPLKKIQGPSSSYTQSSLDLSQGQACPDPHQRKTELWPDLRECASLPPVLSALSPPTEPLSPLHSSDPSGSEHQDSPLHPERHPTSPQHPDSHFPMVSPLDDPQRDIPPPAIDGTTLPSQTFPPPLASKPNLVMPQKPTAYVRPMDGQDQVTSESPDLKPSPEDFHGQSYHEPLPDLKSTKPSLSKLKIPSQSIECCAAFQTPSNEADCVEDILREMTHSWPPLLTAIQTPSTVEPSKFSFPAKEAQHVPPASPVQKHYGSPPLAPPSICQQSSCTVTAAHSSGVESASSSDSESSSGSESGSESSESGTEAPPQPLRSSSPPVTKTEGPVVTNWQLNNWIRVSQQNPSTESQSDALLSPLPKQQQSHEEETIPPRDYKSHTPPHRPEFSDGEAKPQRSEGAAHNQHVQHKSPVVSHVGNSSSNQRKTVGNKHPSRPAKAPRPEDPQAGLQVESVEVVPRDKDSSFTDRPKVKTKTGRSSKSSGAKINSRKPAKRGASEKKTEQPESQGGPKVTLVLDCKREKSPSPSPAQEVDQPAPAVVKTTSVRTETLPAPQKGQKKPRRHSLDPAHKAKRESSAKPSRVRQGPPRALLVKIELSLLSRVPSQGSRPSSGGQEPAIRKGPNTAPERGDTNPAAPIPTKVCKKRPAEKDVKTVPRKKPKLQKDLKPSSGPGSRKSETERKRSKGPPVPLLQPTTTQDPGKGQGGHKRHAVDAPEPSTASATHRRDREASTPVKHKKSAGQRRTEHAKKAPKSSVAFSVPSQPTGAALSSRPLLQFEDRQQPVEYHMKEAKTLKHKADATPDKVGKAFNYLDAAMSFVESGIAMETDPQTPKSAYTMFAETLDLIRFILKLKGSVNPSGPATDKDFTVLCMRGLSLLQMAMFRYKREAALKYSRTLTDHFKSSLKSAAQAPSPCISNTGTPSPMSPMPSPASTASSGPGSNHSSGAGAGTVSTVAIPQVIQQVASSYVNITALFLSAHDIWEQADELAHKGSGLLSELDLTLGPLSLTSTMSSLVRHTRQGLQWLRLDTREAQ